MLLGYLVPAVFGFSTATMILMMLLGLVGSAFAFEAIMKLWAQESFPTLLRTTAQGAIISVARFFCAALASVTPLIMDSGPRKLFFVLAGICFVGLAAAWLGFRKGVANEFNVEDRIHEEAQCVV